MKPRTQSIRPVTDYVLEHADPTSEQHKADKARSEKQRRVRWEPVEVDLAGDDYDYGAPPPGTPGWMFQFVPVPGFATAKSRPQVVPPETFKAYARSIRATRRQYRRLVTRKGKEGKETKRFETQRLDEKESPLREFVCEPTPWVSKLWRENLTPEKQQEVHLRMLGRTRDVLESIGVEALGGGVHEDTNCSHYHVTGAIIDLSRRRVPKAKLNVTGRWAARAQRIKDWGVDGKLSEEEEDWLADALGREREGIDLKLLRALDIESKTICKELGLDLDGALADYKKWKAERPKRKEKDPFEKLSESQLLDLALAACGRYELLFGKRLVAKAYRAKAMALGSLAGAAGAVAVEIVTAAIKKLRKDAKEREQRVERLMQKNKMLDDPTRPGSL